MVDLIQKKRDGAEHSKEEIQFIIKGFMQGRIPDYQISAWAMAVYFNGMSEKELADLTSALVTSGEQLDLSEIKGIKVDKHSTGGVGDTTTLVAAPLAAALGVPVAKMSGPGLGHTGGTVDKLNAIPGFNTDLSKTEFVSLVNKQKLAIIGQTADLTPADKKLYQLRDVTATVDSIPLIASSIMSKKIAAGADCIVLDVKVGSGAFMKNAADAEKLASLMVNIGLNYQIKTMAVISNMDEPLGRMIGNALEVKEAIATLKGNGPKDLQELSIVLASYMLYLANQASSIQHAEEMARETLYSGKALDTFRTFIASQGGDAAVVDNPDQLPKARNQIPVFADRSGYVQQISAQKIGTAAMLLGAGRATKESVIDPAAGIELRKKIGDSVAEGEPLAILHSSGSIHENIITQVKSSYAIASQKQKPKQLIYSIIFD